MTAQVNKYQSTYTHCLDGTCDIDGNPVKMLLLSSAYVFSAAHEVLADVSANEITGTGYTAGGATLANPSIVSSATDAKFTSDDVTWQEATVTARWAVLYIDATINSKVKPLLTAVLLDDTPADVAVTGMDFVVQMPANGWMRIMDA